MINSFLSKSESMRRFDISKSVKVFAIYRFASLSINPVLNIPSAHFICVFLEAWVGGCGQWLLVVLGWGRCNSEGGGDVILPGGKKSTNLRSFQSKLTTLMVVILGAVEKTVVCAWNLLGESYKVISMNFWYKLWCIKYGYGIARKWTKEELMYQTWNPRGVCEL